MPGSPDRTSFTPGRVNVSPSDTQGGSRVPELGPLGSVRGALSNERPYRDLRRLWNEHDVIAQAAQALDQPGGGALTRDLIEIALAEFAEGLAGGQPVEHGD